MPTAVKCSLKRSSFFDQHCSDGCPIWFILQVNICGQLEVFVFVCYAAVYLFRQQLQILYIFNEIRVCFYTKAIKTNACHAFRQFRKLRAAYIVQYRQAVFCEFPCGIRIIKNSIELRRKCSIFIGQLCAIYPCCAISRNGIAIYCCAAPSVIIC